jgi:hypothetical protein
MVNLPILYGALGMVDKIKPLALEEQKVEPGAAFAYQNLATAFIYENRIAEAKAVIDDAHSKGVDTRTFHIFLLFMAYLENDNASVQRELNWSSGKPIAMFMLQFKAEHEAQLGQLKQFRETSQQDISVAQSFGAKEVAAESEAGEGFILGMIGDCSQGLPLVNSSLQHFPGGGNREAAYLTFASCGESAKALKGVEALAAESPESTVVREFDEAVSHALLALEKKDYDGALHDLDGARRFENGGGIDCPIVFGVRYLRGVANLGKKDPAAAINDFQWIADHQYLYPVSQFYRFAELQLARAYAMQGDTVSARKAYQDVLAVWKDADANYAPAQQARAEYAKLTGS